MHGIKNVDLAERLSSQVQQLVLIVWQPCAETESYDQSATWQPKEISLDDGRILILNDS